MSVASAPRGIEAARVSEWFSTHVREAELPLRFSLISGGHSNLSYRAEDAAGHLYVLRRPPLAMLMPSAHDVLRESRVMSALWDTAVPVPAVRGECRDESVTGAIFFVMDHVEGAVLREPAEVERNVTEAARRRLAFELIETLAELHEVDPAVVGLGDLGRGSGYLQRQLRRWRSQWDGWKTRDLEAVDRVEGWLQRNLPERDEVTIVHGDFRLDNTIVSEQGDVAAVLDWELCTLGDPLVDLGVMLAYWVDPGAQPIPHLSAATTLPGFPTGRELVDRYADVSGRDVSTIDLYLSFAYWKTAIVLEGVYARYRSGALGDDHEDFEDIRAAADRLAAEAEMTGPGAPW
jgi:aminoglycoside phosphotransferase (APT) family kinase protein